MKEKSRVWLIIASEYDGGVEAAETTFPAADEKIAVGLHRRGVQLEQIARAILLGSVRKYVSTINGEIYAPITSLQYFVGGSLNMAPYRRFRSPSIDNTRRARIIATLAQKRALSPASLPHASAYP